MHHTTLSDFLMRAVPDLAKGPLAIILVEDEIEVATTLRHHIQSGFAEVLALMPSTMQLPADLQARVHRIDCDFTPEGAARDAINRIIAGVPGAWMYYCYNAEYLFFPFCETRTIRDLLAFHAEERRDAMLTYVVDLYALDLTQFPNAVSLEDAHIDKSGYYALARKDLPHLAGHFRLHGRLYDG